MYLKALSGARASSLRPAPQQPLVYERERERERVTRLDVVHQSHTREKEESRTSEKSARSPVYSFSVIGGDEKIGVAAAAAVFCIVELYTPGKIKESAAAVLWNANEWVT